MRGVQKWGDPNLGCQQIIDKALAKETVNRYQTGQELASARWFLRRLPEESL